jgi:hypothetical protein
MGEGEIVEIRAMEQQWEIVGRVDRVAHLLAWSQLCQQPFGSKVAYGVGDRVKGYRAGRFTPPDESDPAGCCQERRAS